MKHQTISFIKSALRLAGYYMIYLSFTTTFWASHVGITASVLILSEVIGIVEEIGEN